MSDAEIASLRGTLRWVHRNIERIKDWDVPSGVELVVNHIREEIEERLNDGNPERPTEPPPRTG